MHQPEIEAKAISDKIEVIVWIFEVLNSDHTKLLILLANKSNGQNQIGNIPTRRFGKWNWADSQDDEWKYVEEGIGTQICLVLFPESLYIHDRLFVWKAAWSCFEVRFQELLALFAANHKVHRSTKCFDLNQIITLVLINCFFIFDDFIGKVFKLTGHESFVDSPFQSQLFIFDHPLIILGIFDQMLRKEFFYFAGFFTLKNKTNGLIIETHLSKFESCETNWNTICIIFVVTILN